MNIQKIKEIADGLTKDLDSRLPEMNESKKELLLKTMNLKIKKTLAEYDAIVSLVSVLEIDHDLCYVPKSCESWGFTMSERDIAEFADHFIRIINKTMNENDQNKYLLFQTVLRIMKADTL